MKNEIKMKIEKYLEMAKNKGFSENTKKTNVMLIQKFLESEMSLKEYRDFLRETPFKKVKRKDVFRKTSTVNTNINALTGSLKLIDEPFERVSNIKIQKQNFLENTINEKEFKRIIAACEKNGLNRGLRSKALFIFLARTGCRISEALSIEKSQIKSLKKKGGLVTIFGKGDKERQLIITKDVKILLEDYIEKDIYSNKSNKIFNTVVGPMTRQTAHVDLKYFAGAAKVKKDKAHLHNFRHLFCLNAIAAGMDIEELAQIVGHKDINITRIYTAKSSSDLQKILEKIKN